MSRKEHRAKADRLWRSVEQVSNRTVMYLGIAMLDDVVDMSTMRSESMAQEWFDTLTDAADAVFLYTREGLKAEHYNEES